MSAFRERDKGMICRAACTRWSVVSCLSSDGKAAYSPSITTSSNSAPLKPSVASTIVRRLNADGSRWRRAR